MAFVYRPIDTDVEKSIKISTTNHKFKIKKIRFGDSVGRQLFSTGVNENLGEINITSNGAITVLGQYLLLRSLILNNRANISDSLIVEGYFRPASLLNNLDEPTTTNYFLKKFYNDDWFYNDSLLNSNLANRLDYVYLRNYDKRFYIKYLYSSAYVNNVLKIPMLFNTEVLINKSDHTLFDILYPEFKKCFKQFNIYFCPVSKSNQKIETQFRDLLKYTSVSSVNFKVLDDTFFVDDNIHYKSSKIIFIKNAYNFK
jgi:hypothetical protein